MEKLYDERGRVAVAVSCDHGAGWSTWNNVNPMDARFNKLFLDGKHKEAVALCENLGLGYSNGGHKVVIEWLPPGEKFSICEYDGAEYIMTIKDLDHTA